MTSKRALRILSFLLLSVMMASVLFSCKDNPNHPDDTTAPREEETDAPEDELTNTDIIREMYADRDYGGKAFRIYGYQPGDHWYNHVSEGFNEIWFETDSADALSSAIYTRNRRTEDLLGIVIEPYYAGDADGGDITAIMTARDDAYDALAVNLTTTYDLFASSGWLVNFYNIEEIVVTHDWWDQALVNDFTMFGSKLYAMSGDAFAWDDYATALFLTNNDMYDRYGLESPYDLVRAGTWTFDRMLEMAHAVTNDLNNDGHMDELDAWGASCFYGALYHLIFACDMTITVNDYAGMPVLNVNSDEMLDRVEYLFYDVINSGDVMTVGYTEDAMDMLQSGRMLFYHTLVSHIHQFRHLDFNYGVLPMPKYDEAQKRYTTSVNTAWYTCYSVPDTVPDLAFVGTVLETLSGFSTDTVNSTITDTLLGYDSQLLRDDDSSEMLRIVFDGKLIDWSGFDCCGTIRNIFLSQSFPGSFRYVSQLEGSYDAAEALLNEYIQVFDDLP